MHKDDMKEDVIIKVRDKNRFCPTDSKKIFEKIEAAFKYAVVSDLIWRERKTEVRFGIETKTNIIYEHSSQCIDYYKTKQEAAYRLNILPKITNKKYENGFMTERK